MSSAARTILTVLGGSSVSTPKLLVALRRAALERQIEPIDVRLYGRDSARLEGIRAYVERAWSASGAEGNGLVTITTTLDLRDAARGATFILCQVRPGGMAARARDERLALDFGIPADEGLGPSGLLSFLRARQTLEALLEECATVAPDAVMLVLTGPLGMVVALARQYFPTASYGVCELPLTTSARVRAHVEPRLGCGPLNHFHAGLNHQSWLYQFRTAGGVDVTNQVLEAIDDPMLVDVDPEIIRREGAVPVPYLKLLYHAERELARQLAQRLTRGEELQRWSSDLERAYSLPDGPDMNRVASLLGKRNTDWYGQGVVPILRAFLDGSSTTLPLNLPNGGALPSIPANAIVEITSTLSRGRAEPLPVPDLPRGPATLLQRLVRYEAAVLAMRSQARAAIEDALSLHPFVQDSKVAGLATSIEAILQAKRSR